MEDWNAHELIKADNTDLYKAEDERIESREDMPLANQDQGMAIITKCAYDKGKAHICVEYINSSWRQGVMHQLVLSADDVIAIIERKSGKAYSLPPEAL